jgi:hypothetical protein
MAQAALLKRFQIGSVVPSPLGSVLDSTSPTAPGVDPCPASLPGLKLYRRPRQLGRWPTPPPPPEVPTCDVHNFEPGGVVRSSVSDALGSAINCRVLYQNGASTTWLGYDLYSSGNLGVPGLVDLGVQQAIDIFSLAGATYFEGGAVFCLRGTGTLIWLAASNSPRHAEIIGSYSVPEFPGFTCATLFEPGTLVLVSENPVGP